ncbi:MAG TPA: hypothetical protein VJP79_11400 [Nitrososphaera sp.]|jgi:hypothetical protein|nr:hypothetical protein [Nitrososphaera sp.]
MPITKSEFEKGRSEDPIIHRIQGFLESNREYAYTEEEIMKHMYPEHIAWPGDTIAFNSAMLILAYAGKIELRYINAELGVKTYFRARS